MITTRDFQWSWQGQHLVLGLDEAGDGALVLLLPALSSISTRGEMRPLMERLVSQFRVVAIDWPGFGTRPRPNVRWTPDALSTFLQHVLEQVVGRPHGIVAAGHAASYVLDCASRRSGITDRLVLIAPTWRGPLPTVAGGDRPFFAKIRSAIEMPGIGSLLYRLNVNSFVVGKMVAGHVYSDSNWLSGERLIEKRQVMAAPGARFASAALCDWGIRPCIKQSRFLGARCARRRSDFPTDPTIAGTASARCCCWYGSARCCRMRSAGVSYEFSNPLLAVVASRVFTAMFAEIIDAFERRAAKLSRNRTLAATGQRR